MQIALKSIWITAIVVISLSLMWFLLGSTAFFQRNIDIVTTFIFTYVWVPALLLIGVSILCLKKGWVPSNIFIQIGLAIGIITLSVIFSSTLFRYVNTSGWLKESVTADYTQTTPDGKYEYKLELINLFQKNSCSRLSVKDISTGNEMTIPVDIRAEEIRAIIAPDSTRTVPHIPSWVWAEMTRSGAETVYILTTTEHLKDTIEKFEIDMEAKTAKKIE